MPTRGVPWAPICPGPFSAPGTTTELYCRPLRATAARRASSSHTSCTAITSALSALKRLPSQSTLRSNSVWL